MLFKKQPTYAILISITLLISVQAKHDNYKRKNQKENYMDRFFHPSCMPMCSNKVKEFAIMTHFRTECPKYAEDIIEAMFVPERFCAPEEVMYTRAHLLYEKSKRPAFSVPKQILCASNIESIKT